MSEKQEKVWVVMKDRYGESLPAKVFDDRNEARAYARQAEARSSKFWYSVIGVKKG